MKQINPKSLTLKTLNKGNVWEVQENDIFRMWEAAEKDAELKDNMRHYQDIIRSAFETEEVKVDRPEVIQKYKDRGFQVANIRIDENRSMLWAIKKRPIMRVTDLTYENIRHITAAKLIEVLGRNFGGGWESLSQSIRDIIESGFDISTTTLPQVRLHKAGGMFEKKVNDGFQVLEIPKGTWVEAIFAKEKPEVEKPRVKYENEKALLDDELNDDEDLPEMDEKYDDDEDEFDDDKLTEESYRTTFDAEEDLDLDAADVVDDEDY